MHDKSKYADCKFRRSARMCSALKDTYCDYEDCNFYNPGAVERRIAVPEKPKRKHYGGHPKTSDERIAKIRELYKSGMTQEEVAKAVGASQMTVSKYVRGI